MTLLILIIIAVMLFKAVFKISAPFIELFLFAIGLIIMTEFLSVGLLILAILLGVKYLLSRGES